MRLIVIVDDRSTNRTIFARLAASLGADIRVETFATPQEALDWFATAQVPDLVITDYKMPRMDGAAFTARIRALDWGYDVPVVVVTAYEDRNYRLSALEAGATDFLLSPVDHTEFLTRARNLLRLSWYQKRVRSRALQLEEELISSRRAHDDLLRGSRDRLLQVIDTVPAMISATDRDGNYIFVNQFHENILGRQSRCDDAAALALDRQVLACGEPTARYEESFVDRHGVRWSLLTSKIPFCDDTSGERYVLTTSLDITDRKKSERELHNLAYFDQLTGLPNRSHLEKHAQTLLTGEGERPFAFFLLDLDRFKSVNDTQGHTIGDQLLRQVAARLQSVLPHAGLIARLGGDEFAILHDVDDMSDAGELAEQITGVFVAPFILGDLVMNVGASVGIALSPDPALTFETMLKRADLAMYRAKNEGLQHYAFFETAMEHAVSVAADLEQALRQATENGAFTLHYQPEIDLASGRVTGVEALIRWVRPDGELVYPGHFLPLAEETGLIVPMTIWTLREACRQGTVWGREGINIRIAVNLSGMLFRHHDVQKLVLDAITETGLDPTFLELELTETALIENPEVAGRQLAALQDMGVSVAIDDFGTGYASMIYLTTMPIRRLKIDALFVREIDSSSSSRAIIKAIIALGNNLDICVIAEGIEREEQLQWLKEQGCDQAQGFLFSRPVPAERFQQMVRAGVLTVSDGQETSERPDGR